MAPHAQCGYNAFKSDDTNLRNLLLLDLQETGMRFVDKLVETDEFSEYPPTHFLVNRYQTLNYFWIKTRTIAS